MDGLISVYSLPIAVLEKIQTFGPTANGHQWTRIKKEVGFCLFASVRGFFRDSIGAAPGTS